MKTILLVDDEDFTREHFGRLIARFGFEVVSAASGKEGIEAFKSKRADAVFLDINLTDINGADVFRQIRKTDAGTKIYFLSGSEADLRKVQGLGIDASGYINKPLDVVEIKKLLEELKG